MADVSIKIRIMDARGYTRAERVEGIYIVGKFKIPFFINNKWK